MVNSRSKGLLIVAAFAVVVACGFWALVGDDAETRHQGPMVLGPTSTRPEVAKTPVAPPPDAPVVVRTAGARGRTDVVPARKVSQAVRAFSAESTRDKVTGLVRAEDGEPLEGATVTARLLLEVGAEVTGGEVVASTVTDGDGEYAMGGFLRVGERYVVDVSHDAHAVARSGVIDPLDPDTTIQNLVLRQGVSITGSVRGRDGTPLGGASVSVHDIRLNAQDPAAGPDRLANVHKKLLQDKIDGNDAGSLKIAGSLG